MKTELYLLLQTDGRPIMNVGELASLLNLTPRSLQNQVYAGRCEIPTFKLGGGLVAHVADVAKYIDGKRAEAVKEVA